MGQLLEYKTFVDEGKGGQLLVQAKFSGHIGDVHVEQRANLKVTGRGEREAAVRRQERVYRETAAAPWGPWRRRASHTPGNGRRRPWPGARKHCCWRTSPRRHGRGGT